MEFFCERYSNLHLYRWISCKKSLRHIYYFRNQISQKPFGKKLKSVLIKIMKMYCLKSENVGTNISSFH